MHSSQASADQLQQAQAKNAALESKISTLMTEVQEARLLQAAAEAASAETTTASEEKLTKISSESQRLQRINVELEAHVLALTESCGANRDQLEHADARLQELQVSNGALHDKVSTLMKQMQDADARTSAAEAMAKRANESSVQAELELELSRSATAELETVIQSSLEMEDRLQSAQTAASEAQAAKAQLEVELVEVTASRLEAQTAAATVEQALKEQRLTHSECLRASLEEMRERLCAAEATAQALETSKAQLEVEAAELMKSCNDKQAAVETAHAELSSAYTRLEDTAFELAKARPATQDGWSQTPVEKANRTKTAHGHFIGEVVQVKATADEEWQSGTVTELVPLRVRTFAGQTSGIWACVRRTDNARSASLRQSDSAVSVERRVSAREAAQDRNGRRSPRAEPKSCRNMAC